MATFPITRHPDESHDQFWSLFLRFGRWRESNPTNHAGRRFGAWRVIGLEGWGAGGQRWLVHCDCGTNRVLKINNLLKSISTSCGCQREAAHLTHGMSRTRPYKIWAGMLTRCRNPESDSFPAYGGRGIEVCDLWLEFEGFWRDMQRGYSSVLTLERLDVNGHYEPGNCAWIPKPEQLQNLRRTVRIQTPHGQMTLRQASNAFGIKRETLRGRIRYGWPEWRLLEGYC